MTGPSETCILESLFQSALDEYEKQTKINLVGHPLAVQIQRCNNVESITDLIQDQARAFLEYRGGNHKALTFLKRTVQALHNLSGAASLVESIGLVC